MKGHKCIRAAWSRVAWSPDGIVNQYSQFDYRLSTSNGSSWETFRNRFLFSVSSPIMDSHSFIIWVWKYYPKCKWIQEKLKFKYKEIKYVDRRNDKMTQAHTPPFFWSPMLISFCVSGNYNTDAFLLRSEIGQREGWNWGYKKVESG